MYKSTHFQAKKSVQLTLHEPFHLWKRAYLTS